MKTLYEQVLVKVKRLDELSSSVKAKDGTDYYPYMEKHKVARVKFIEFCLENKITYDQIACILGLSKGRVFQIAHYKETGVLTARERVIIRKRDKYACVICGIVKNLQIHHIHNPKEKPAQNLITLCPKHHRAVHKQTLTVEEFLVFNKKVEIIKKKKVKQW